jgi:RNA polymerase sigma-70 factor (ECF subfamily)
LADIRDERSAERLTAKEPSGRQVAEGRELADWLRAELDRLPPQERQAVHLVCVEGLAQADAAAILDIPVNTVKTHLRRGRVASADALARRHAAEAREVAR